VRQLASIAILISGLAASLGPAQAAAFQRVGVNTVHGLFGGFILWLSADSESFMQSIGPSRKKPGFFETRYRFQLTSNEVEALEAILATYPPWHTDCTDRSLATDQSLDRIWMQDASGLKAACKWNGTNRPYPNFDAVIAFARKLARSHATSPYIVERPYHRVAEKDWPPPGFPTYRQIVDVLKRP